MSDSERLFPPDDIGVDPAHRACFGPVECAWWPYRHGERAEPRVRAWLGARFGWSAETLSFIRDARGRPMLAREVPGGAHVGVSSGHEALGEPDVNWSHSGDWLIAACAPDARIGIDIELLRPRPRAQLLACRFFHPDEAAVLSGLDADPARQQRTFTRLWCAKEAVLKAHGYGLSFGLDRLHFVCDDVTSDDPGRGDVRKDSDDFAVAPRLIACDPGLGTPDDWRLWSWAPVPGYLATLALRLR